MQRRAPVVVAIVHQACIVGAQFPSLLAFASSNVPQQHAARDVALDVVQLALLRLEVLLEVVLFLVVVLPKTLRLVVAVLLEVLIGLQLTQRLIS